MTGAALRVLIAPDCFGDSLTAVQAAQAIADGWRQARPDDALTLAPQSDGGPGFVDVLASRLGELRHMPRVRAAGRRRRRGVGVRRRVGTAYIECAQACGLALLGGPPTVQTAVAAHSSGVGQLIDAALDGGRRAGSSSGSAAARCTDGGRGLVDALGGLAAARDRLAGVDLIAATDVEHPLLGPMGAAARVRPAEGRRPGHRRRCSRSG